MKTGSVFYSIFNFKCPHCHKGDFFVSKPYNIKNIGKIHNNCNVCKMSYSPEPGFYYGAMYVSYALGVAIAVASFLLTYIFYPKANYIIYLSIIICVEMIMGPFTFHLSKIIWANLFMRFKG